MKTFGAWVFVVIWFFHLLIGAGAGFAMIRLWPERRVQFIRYTAIHLTAAIFDSLGAIVVLFLSRGVKFTWKFSIGLFGFMLLRDLARIPLIVYIVRGPKPSIETDGEDLQLK